MIIGLGLDLCSISRMEALIAKWGTRFTERVFTPTEREYVASKANPAQHLAARFAVKEATLKALNVPSGCSWQEMEVRGGGSERPQLHLSGRADEAATLLRIDAFFVTITHAADVAAAVVIAERVP